MDSVFDASSPKRILVVADATKEQLSSEAMTWAIQSLAEPGDTLRFLGILHQVNNPMGYKSRVDPGMFGVNAKKQEDEIVKIFVSNHSYFENLQGLCEAGQVGLKTAIIPGFPARSVLIDDAKAFNASWVVLDRFLKKETKYLSEQLPCSLVIMNKNGCAKVIRYVEPSQDHDESSQLFDLPFSASVSVCADESSSGHAILSRTRSLPSLQMFSPDLRRVLPRLHPAAMEKVVETSNEYSRFREAPKEYRPPVAVRAKRASELDMLKHLDADDELDRDPFASLEREVEPDPERVYHRKSKSMTEYESHKVITGGRGPTSLCSVCNNKSLRFGSKPTALQYSDIEEATSMFSRDNLLGAGGFGYVYKGKLKDGQLVAVKLHKLASTQGDREFYAEVEVLSSAQHRNLITLIGYCTEDGRRILIYEYACNASLYWHLFKSTTPLDWPARLKVALGAARGLRYLHEECRIGCIVHRDMRPHNILVTHDFTALVGDFGLARWQARGDTAEQTRVVGTIGYMAPEYTVSGQLTEKADVFAFGVVLLEIITGRPAFDSTRAPGHEHLDEWARAALETRATHMLLDKRMDESTVDGYELINMVNAACRCIQKDPTKRPRMSQVVKILEGDDREATPLSPVKENFDVESLPGFSYYSSSSTSGSTKNKRSKKKITISYTEMLL